MAEHQKLGTFLKTYYRENNQGTTQSNVTQDYSGMNWDHHLAQLDNLELVTEKSKTVTDEIKATKFGVEAHEHMKIVFNMDRSFVIGKDGYATSVTMEIPANIRQHIAGVPEHVTFPHVGEHTINMKNTCPILDDNKWRVGEMHRLKFEEKVYKGDLKVQTYFNGTARFDGNSVNVKQAIAAMSNRCNQCLENGDFVSLGSCKIITRKYCGEA